MSKADYWKNYIESFPTSGLTLHAFCQQHELSLHNFQYWRKKFKKQSPVRQPTLGSPKFVPLNRTSTLNTQVRLYFGDSVHLRVPLNALGTTLTQLKAEGWLGMIRPRSDAQVYLYTGKVDMRKSIDGLAALVQNELALNSLQPAIFVFCNRQHDKIKLLYWERNGFVIWYKRLEQQRFQWLKTPSEMAQGISGKELNWLLDGLDIFHNKPHKKLIILEAEIEAATESQPKKARAKAGRKPLPAALPREIREYDVPEAKRVCSRLLEKPYWRCGVRTVRHYSCPNSCHSTPSQKIRVPSL
jgi:transposase